MTHNLEIWPVLVLLDPPKMFSFECATQYLQPIKVFPTHSLWVTHNSAMSITTLLNLITITTNHLDGVVILFNHFLFKCFSGFCTNYHRKERSNA